MKTIFKIFLAVLPWGMQAQYFHGIYESIPSATGDEKLIDGFRTMHFPNDFEFAAAGSHVYTNASQTIVRPRVVAIRPNGSTFLNMGFEVANTAGDPSLNAEGISMAENQSGFVVVGKVSDNPSTGAFLLPSTPSSDVLIMHLLPNGVLSSAIRMDLGGNEIANAVVFVQPLNRFFVTGTSFRANGSATPFFISLTTGGPINIVNAVTLELNAGAPGNLICEGKSIAFKPQTNTFLIAGSIRPTAGGDLDGLLAEVNPVGQLVGGLARRYFLQPGTDEYFNSVAVTQQGGILLTGEASPPWMSVKQMLVIHIGASTWYRIYHTSNHAQGYKVLERFNPHFMRSEVFAVGESVAVLGGVNTQVVYYKIDNQITPGTPMVAREYGWSDADQGRGMAISNFGNQQTDGMAIFGAQVIGPGPTRANIIRTYLNGVTACYNQIPHSFSDYWLNTTGVQDSPIQWNATNPLHATVFNYQRSLLCNASSVPGGSNLRLTGLEEDAPIQSSLSLYPNPAENNIFIGRENKFSSGAAVHVTVFDVRGKLVKDQTLSGEELVLDVSDLAPGFYLLRASCEGAEYKGRFTK